MRRAGLYIAISSVLFSCIKEVPLIPGGTIEPRPVFHLYINPDSALHADYSRVTGITDKNTTVDMALISVYRNNIPQGDMTSQGSGKYNLNPNQFLPRDSFRIYAADGLYSYFISGKVPSKVVIDKVDTQTLLIPGVGPAFAMDVTFTDSAVDDNFYRMSLIRTWYKYKIDINRNRIDSSLITGFVNISGSERPFIQNNFNNYTSREILFSDATFNGTTSKFRVHTTGQVHETLTERTLSLRVVLENIEKPLFDYYNTRNAHLWQQQSISQLPGTIMGNVGPGYGVAGAYTSTQKIILIK